MSPENEYLKLNSESLRRFVSDVKSTQGYATRPSLQRYITETVDPLLLNNLKEDEVFAILQTIFREVKQTIN